MNINSAAGIFFFSIVLSPLGLAGADDPDCAKSLQNIHLTQFLHENTLTVVEWIGKIAVVDAEVPLPHYSAGAVLEQVEHPKSDSQFKLHYRLVNGTAEGPGGLVVYIAERQSNDVYKVIFVGVPQGTEEYSPTVLKFAHQLLETGALPASE